MEEKMNPVTSILKKGLLASVLVVGMILPASANDLSHFQKRFSILRDQNGKLIAIRDRSIALNFKVRPYLEMVKNQMIEEQALLAEKGNYDAQIIDLLREDMDESFTNSAERERQEKIVLASLKEVGKLDVDKIFQNPTMNEVVSLYENKMSDVLLKLDPSLIAVTNDPTHFYKKNVTYQVVKWGLDFARKRLSQIPMLNTASYIMVQVEKLITERRMFHQNMLLHYLEIFKPEELGLTKEEVDLVWSSIYESRIAWFNFFESDAAKSNWKKYGINKFYASFRMASQVLRDNQTPYSSLDERMNFAFQKVTLNGESVAINLFDKEGMFFNKPAVAYNFNRPTVVARKRVVLSLAQLGLSFVPLSAYLKDTASNFIKSFYEKQRLTEGALYGYLEANNQKDDQVRLIKQYMNPFETSLL
jgi:hypothetical protein